KRQLSRDYHRVTIVIAAIILPATFLICFYSTEILQLITASADTAEKFSALLTIRTLGTAINISIWLPHVIQLATGLSSFVLILNVIGASIYLPGVVLLTPIYGVIVPAVLWLMVGIVWFIPMIIVTHRRALRGETWIWVEGSILRPVFVALVVIAVS